MWSFARCAALCRAGLAGSLCIDSTHPAKLPPPSHQPLLSYAYALPLSWLGLAYKPSDDLSRVVFCLVVYQAASCLGRYLFFSSLLLPSVLIRLISHPLHGQLSTLDSKPGYLYAVYTSKSRGPSESRRQAKSIQHQHSSASRVSKKHLTSEATGINLNSFRFLTDGHRHPGIVRTDRDRLTCPFHDSSVISVLHHLYCSIQSVLLYSRFQRPRLHQSGFLTAWIQPLYRFAPSVDRPPVRLSH